MNKQTLSVAGALIAMMATSGTAHAQASSSPYTHATRYDLAGRVTGTISPNDAALGYAVFLATRTIYDGAGRPSKVESGYLTSWQSEAVAPANWPIWTGSAGFRIETTVETTYNAQNQKLTERVKGADGLAYSLIQHSYDTSGRLECTAVRMNTAIYGSLPSSACMPGAEGSQGPDRITRNFYDVAGQLVQVREGVGTSIEAAEVTYGYTNNGKIEYVVDAGGHKARKCYDGFDRQTRWVFPSSTNPGSFNDATAAQALSTAGAVNGDCTGTLSTSDYEEYSYDLNGNRTSFRKRDGSVLTYQYDFLNRNTVKFVPDRAGLDAVHERDVYYTYDLHGRTLKARFDSVDGWGITNEYDGFGRLTRSIQSSDGAWPSVYSYYDANGYRTAIKDWTDQIFNYHRNGLGKFYYTDLNGSSPLFHAIYDGIGQLTALHRYDTSSWATSPYTGFGYDQISRLSIFAQYLTGTTYDSTTTLSYNPANQITSTARTNDLYAYPGNVTLNRAYVSNGLNQYSSVAGSGFAYDKNGNLTSDGSDTYTYDIENRLVSRSGPGGTVTLRYDPLGRLENLTGPTSSMTRFQYDGDAVIAEYDGSWNLLRRYVHGPAPGADDPMVWFEGSSLANSARRYLYADERGSIVAITDSSGNVTNVNKYDEYGIPASGNVGRFQYTGQAWLPELGMYYYKARMYSPTLGRFMQTDPIGYEDHFNLYGYVGNDPINGIDPTGWATVSARYTPTGSHIKRTGSVTVNADFNNDGVDDLSQSELNAIGKDFSGFIAANDGADISGAGKKVVGDGSLRDKTFTRVVSQFVGASGLARGWDKIDYIDVSARDYFSWGEDAAYGAYKDDPTRGVIFITGSPEGWLGNYLYDSPSNMARALFHEVGHTPRGRERDHFSVDNTAKRNLLQSGLGGGGCWRYGPPGEGFAGC